MTYSEPKVRFGALSALNAVKFAVKFADVRLSRPLPLNREEPHLMYFADNLRSRLELPLEIAHRAQTLVPDSLFRSFTSSDRSLLACLRLLGRGIAPSLYWKEGVEKTAFALSAHVNTT